MTGEGAGLHDWGAGQDIQQQEAFSCLEDAIWTARFIHNTQIDNNRLEFYTSFFDVDHCV